MNLLGDRNRNKDKHLNNLSERLNNLYPDPEDKDKEGITHWQGKKIIPGEDWKRMAITGIKGSLLKEPFFGFAPIVIQYFPDGLVEAALAFEGCSVDPYDESIFPYHDHDDIPLPGTLEHKMSLDSPESKLSDAELMLWHTRVEERRARAKKEDPVEIWIEEYKELLRFKDPEYDEKVAKERYQYYKYSKWYFHKSSWCMRGIKSGYDGKGCNNAVCVPECKFYPSEGKVYDGEGFD